ncbi:MAG: PucR family transcriptional regulator, partial [Thermocrispum sp.]
LDGSASPRRAVAELGLADTAHRVVAVDTGRAGAGNPEGLRLALLERIGKRIGASPAGCELAGTLYVVVPADRADWDTLSGLLDHRGHGSLRAAAGSAQAIAELARSRAEADETLGLLRAGVITGPVVSYDEAWTALALHRVAVAAGGSGAVELGPLGTLREHDERKHTAYLDTLYAWLRHPGDPRSAARELAIHPNTLRYRLRKLLDLTALDLDDPDVRLALLTQLVALRWS